MLCDGLRRPASSAAVRPNQAALNMDRALGLFGNYVKKIMAEYTKALDPATIQAYVPEINQREFPK